MQLGGFLKFYYIYYDLQSWHQLSWLNGGKTTLSHLNTPTLLQEDRGAQFESDGGLTTRAGNLRSACGP